MIIYYTNAIPEPYKKPCINMGLISFKFKWVFSNTIGFD